MLPARSQQIVGSSEYDKAQNIIKRKHSLKVVPYNKKIDPLYIRRPPNSFMLFRKHFVANRPEGFNTPENTTLSKQAGDTWRLLPFSEKKKWAKKAHDISVEHARKNPNWKYRPARKSNKQRQEGQTQQPPEKQGLVIFHADLHHSTNNPTLLPDNSYPPNLMRRKESFRLQNWDDSVLFPTSHEGTQSFDQIQHAHQLLSRRSSSVPIPDVNTNQSFSSIHSDVNFYPAGTRPGFLPMNTFSESPAQFPQPYSHVPRPTSSHEENASRMFEGYRITYLPTIHHSQPPEGPLQPVWPARTTSCVSPIPQVPPGLEAPVLDKGCWDETQPLDVPLIHFADGPEPTPQDPHSVLWPLTDIESDIPSFIASQNKSLHVEEQTGHLAERIRSLSIDVDTAEFL